MPDFGIFRGFNSKLFSDKLFAGQLPTQLGLIGSINILPLLLDLYPNAAAAYSVRKLRSAYTGSAIRVRRSSDNTEQDIGFTISGELDTSSLTSFCGSGNGFVTTWYDQSGNARNATQTTAANQPQIVSSGNVILMNSKPSVQFDGTNDFLSTTSFSLVTNDISLINVFKFNALTSFQTFISFGGFVTNGFLFQRPNIDVYRYATNGIFSDYGNTLTTNQSLIELYDMSTGFTDVYRNTNLLNTNLQTTSINGSNVLEIGRRADSSSQYSTINAQEFIIYPSDQSSNRTGIESNINSFYSIY